MYVKASSIMVQSPIIGTLNFVLNCGQSPLPRFVCLDRSGCKFGIFYHNLQQSPSEVSDTFVPTRTSKARHVEITFLSFCYSTSNRFIFCRSHFKARSILFPFTPRHILCFVTQPQLSHLILLARCQ